MFSILMAALVAQAASAPAPVADVRQLSVTEQKVIAEIDTNKVQGTPVGLAWRTDGTIYLRIQGKDKARHYQIVTVPRASVGQVDDLPQWAATYWSWKSAIVAPGDPTLKLEVEQRADRTRSVGGNSGGELAGMTSQALAGGSAAKACRAPRRSTPSNEHGGTDRDAAVQGDRRGRVGQREPAARHAYRAGRRRRWRCSPTATSRDA